MILGLLTALFVLAIGASSLYCLALGLLSLSRYIESHASRSRLFGLRMVFFTAIAQVLILLIDDVPFLPLLPNLAASALHFRALQPPNWPFTSSPSSAIEGLISLIILPLTSHILLVRNHTRTAHAWHQHRYDTIHRPKLPGGRLDWDVSHAPPSTKEMTNMQVCSVLVICVWSIPIYRLLGRIAAAEWGSAGVVPEGSGKR